MPTTLFDKIWAAHEVAPGLTYIDLHLVHEVTSPQAFDGLRLAGRPVRRPDRTIATADHNVPTDGTPVAARIKNELSRVQVETLERNCAEFGIPVHSLGSDQQGIVHVIGPELGLTQPGMTIVCGDSHTATHGAFGALAFGIGTSEVEHVLATQTLSQPRLGTLALTVNGELPAGSTAKDIILAILARIGTGGGIGYVAEYRGAAIEALSMEGRMTVCNMSIEAGAKAGLIAPDQTTFDYLAGRTHAPTGDRWDAAIADWSTLRTDDDATFDAEVRLDAAEIAPHISWGTNPGQVIRLDGRIPAADDFADPVERAAAERALEYTGLTAGTPIKDVGVDVVFIGSCTNSRIEDLRAVAEVAGSGPVFALLVLFGLNCVDELDRTGFGILLPNIRDELWLKLWGNAGFNPISALTHGTLDLICSDPGTRAVTRSMMVEAQQIAETFGVKFRVDVDRRIEGGRAETHLPHRGRGAAQRHLGEMAAQISQRSGIRAGLHAAHVLCLFFYRT